MINNRQNGRRRGRGGGQRSPNVPNSGNRQDNRQRGNAAQLHEKYKALARDAQLAGDRVQTEYYLQFADHYFRVLNEGRARFEEQRRQRDDYIGDDDDDQAEAGAAENEDRFDRDAQSDEGGGYRNGSDGRNYRDADNRSYRDPRNGGEQPQASDYRNGGEAESEPRYGNEARTEERPSRPRRERTRFEPREARSEEGEAAEERISLDALPPAITPAEAEAEAPRAPRRRTRRPRTEEGDADIAPAA